MVYLHESSNISVFLTQDHLSTEIAVSKVRSKNCGAINIFVGCIREDDFKLENGKWTKLKLNSIFYQAYEQMVINQIERIVQEIYESGPIEYKNLCRFYIGIRLGEVNVGETSIIVASSSPKSNFSHSVTLEILRRIKVECVIYKKLCFVDGSTRWIDSTNRYQGPVL